MGYRNGGLDQHSSRKPHLHDSLGRAEGAASGVGLVCAGQPGDGVSASVGGLDEVRGLDKVCGGDGGFKGDIVGGRRVGKDGFVVMRLFIA